MCARCIISVHFLIFSKFKLHFVFSVLKILNFTWPCFSPFPKVFQGRPSLQPFLLHQYQWGWSQQISEFEIVDPCLEFSWTHQFAYWMLLQNSQSLFLFAFSIFYFFVEESFYLPHHFIWWSLGLMSMWMAGKRKSSFIL